jgi:sec-independent protein translocase protein TatC
VATPTAEPMSMFLLMAPLTALFFIAVGITMANDKRRARKLDKFVDDDISID